MTRWDGVRTVAWWEFRRFYKIRDQILALVLALVVGAISYAFKAAADSGRDDVKVAVVNTSNLAVPPEFNTFLKLVTVDVNTPREELGKALERKDYDGVLFVSGADDAELLVRKEPYWIGDLTMALTQARAGGRLKEYNISGEKMADVLAPMKVDWKLSDGGVTPKQKGEKILAAVVVALSMLGVWIGLAFFLVGITGEKQLRVTEQVVAALSPQTWIDGKLIGLTGVSLASMGTYLLAGTVVIVLMRLGGTSVPIPEVAGSPGLILSFLLLAVLGILFWNCFFAAVSATINDPYTSARGSLMMIPLIPVFMAGFSMSNPDANWIRVLGMTPGFSSSVLPARMVLTEVAWWEPVVAVTLLVVGIWMMRRLAGKVFAAGILIYGKEPTFREMWKWMRQS